MLIPFRLKLFTAIVLLLISCSTLQSSIPEETAPDQPLTSVEACYSSVSAAHSPLWYAYENKIFEKYGLDISITSAGGGSSAATAMIAGDFKICQIAAPAVLNAVIAGEDLVFFGGLYNDYLYKLMVTPDIKSPQDLKGKAVAITQPGTLTDGASRAALLHLGLDPDKDVILLNIGGEPTRLAAMDSGQVAATVFTPPNTLKAQEAGFNILLDLVDLNQPFLRLGYAASRSFMEGNPEVMVNFSKAIIEAIQEMQSDPEGTKSIMAEYLSLDEETDAESLVEAYQELILKNVSETLLLPPDGIEAVLEIIITQNPAAVEYSAGDFIDTRIIEEINKSGFVESLK